MNDAGTDRNARREAAAFVAPYAPPDEDIARELLIAARRNDAAEARVNARATRLIEQQRFRQHHQGEALAR